MVCYMLSSITELAVDFTISSYCAPPRPRHCARASQFCVFSAHISRNCYHYCATLRWELMLFSFVFGDYMSYPQFFSPRRDTGFPSLNSYWYCFRSFPVLLECAKVSGYALRRHPLRGGTSADEEACTGSTEHTGKPILGKRIDPLRWHPGEPHIARTSGKRFTMT
ncbi:hypothetical protein BJV77DRAFT_320429 [Russula vinacea]|nr:hypothetical protein BJV77DRAFT_320429 [Russula vinacea]